MRASPSQLRLVLAALAACVAAFIACGPPPPPPDPTPDPNPHADGGTGLPDGGVSCDVQAPTVCPTPAPTYSDVEPIIQSRCVVCHSGTIGGPWALTDYPHVADWKNEVRGNLLDCSMPPSDAGFVMPEEERTRILEWVLCGAKQ